MLVRNVEADIKWLERAIEETEKRIAWNEENRWFTVVDGEWTDATAETNDRLRYDIAQCRVMLEHNRKKLAGA